MQPNDSIDQIYYNSRYRHGVDGKRRVQVPAKWRSPKGEILTLILWPKNDLPEACLLVLPPAEWNGLVQKLKAMPFAEPRAQALRHLVGMNSDRVTLDKAGRICLPEAMAKAAAIEQDALLVGLVDRFEIWNPDRYAAASAKDNELLSEAFKLI